MLPRLSLPLSLHSISQLGGTNPSPSAVVHAFCKDLSHTPQ
jgi:hypothetical protein